MASERKEKTKKLGCLFHLHLVCNENGLQIKKFTDHSCSIKTTLKKEKLNAEESKMVATGFALKAKSNKMRNLLNKTASKNFRTTQYILNVKYSTAEYLEKRDYEILDNKQYHKIFTPHPTKNINILSVIIFQDHFMRRKFKSYGDVLIMDSTHNISDKNNLTWKLFFILVINGNGDSELATYFLTINETLTCLYPIFKILSKQNDFSMPQTIFTGKDIKERNIITSFFPNATPALCDFHVRKLFSDKIRQTQSIFLNKITQEDLKLYPKKYLVK